MSLDRELVQQILPRVVHDHWGEAARSSADDSGWAQALWDVLAGTGLPWVSVPEEAGGSGGDLLDALAILWEAGRAGIPLPLSECSLLGGSLLALVGRRVPDGVLTVAPGTPSDTVLLEGSGSSWVLSGTLNRVPAATHAKQILAVARSGVEEMLC